MAKILTDDVIPELKSKVEGNRSNIKFYDDVQNTDGVINITDSSLSLGSAYPGGLHFMFRSYTDISNPKLKFNGLSARDMHKMHIGGGWSIVTNIKAYDMLEVVWLQGSWRVLNNVAPITKGDIAAEGFAGKVWATDFAVADDTPAGWVNALGGDGRYLIYYSSPNKFASQPNQWGWLEVSVKWAEVSMIWHDQPGGDIHIRAGNVNGWNSSWRRLAERDRVWPVGSIYMSYTLDTPEKVAAALGGTWIRSSEGASIFGYKASDTTFNNVSNTGGAKTVALTTAQMPAHTHTRGTMEITGQIYIGQYGRGQSHIYAGSGALSEIEQTSVYSVGGGELSTHGAGLKLTASKGWTGATSSVGSGEAHNNMPPYGVRYIYRRIA